MIHLSKDDQWFPSQVSRVSVDAAGDEIVVVMTLAHETVTGRFPVEERHAMFAALREWLCFICNSAGAASGPVLEGWAANVSAKLLNHALGPGGSAATRE